MAALLLGYDVNTAEGLGAGRHQELLISQKEYLRAYSSDDINNMMSGDAWVHHMWSGDFLYLKQGLADDPTDVRLRGPERGHPDQLRHLRDPDQRPAPRHRDGVHRLPAPPRERHQEHELPLLPVPCQDALPAFADLAKDVPACNVEISDLENENVSGSSVPTRSQRRAATGPK